ncbi:MAG TPA: YetF domain-containing protein [Chitinophagaceae bacterium]|jgi:uncharacterized membrane protein YcaP (DUF421 family)|nr:YetF domain-containing protein [Chitinophagaceae bacterium]
MNITDIFGSGEDLSPTQMAVRAFVMFFIALMLIRLAGMRVFGIKTAFDNILVIMLGAILSRGIVGASPFFSTVAAAAAMIVVHKFLAWLAMKHEWVGKIVKGYRHSLYHDGKVREENLRRTAVSKDDLMEGVRLEINKNSLDEVEQIFIEKTGEISVVKKT